MATLQNIYQKMMPTLNSTAVAQPPPETNWAEPARSISREVAHELNNILTIIQGYSERMLLKNGDNPALRHDLQVITESTQRAVQVVRQAAPRPAAPLPARATN